MSKFWIVALEVYRKYVKSVSFALMSLAPLFMIGGVWLTAEIAVKTAVGSTDEVAVVTEDETLFTAFQTAQSDGLRCFLAPSPSAASRLLKEKDIRAYVTLEQKNCVLYGRIYMNTAWTVMNMEPLRETLNSIQRELTGRSLNLTPADIALLNAPAEFESIHLDFSDDDFGKETPDYSAARGIVVMLLIAIVFMLITVYVAIISLEIASEKGTRIMEIMLSSVKAETHFYAKLTGIGLVCLTEVGFYILLALGLYPYIKNIEWVNYLLGINFLDIFGGLFIFTLPIVLFNVLLYMILGALSGSLVSRVEEASQASQPVIYIALISYFCSFLFNNEPKYIVVRLISYIPGWSVCTMPARLARNGAALWEVLLSLGLLIITDMLLLLFSARMYKSNVLMYSGRGLIKALKQSIAGLKTEI
ncbi:MAG: ABC transporter permease [Spirochaetaceae bacterium]|jgi:ABC-2 type transport system permease protein|nr:ABC transporter permease [Spirochaetaceae bacterium]